MPGAGCVRPKLLSLGKGKPLLLSGGRLCVENTTDLSVWINFDGMAGYGAAATTANLSNPWVKHSLSYEHNRLWAGRGNASADLFHPAWINNVTSQATALVLAISGPILRDLCYVSPRTGKRWPTLLSCQQVHTLPGYLLRTTNVPFGIPLIFGSPTT